MVTVYIFSCLMYIVVENGKLEPDSFRFVVVAAEHGKWKLDLLCILSQHYELTENCATWILQY